jgi:hypothetical protein
MMTYARRRGCRQHVEAGENQHRAASTHDVPAPSHTSFGLLETHQITARMKPTLPPITEA